MQWCHLNLFKPYFFVPSVPEVDDGSISAGSAAGRSVAAVGVVLAGDFYVPSEPILTGNLKNLQYLSYSPCELSCLPDVQQADLMRLSLLSFSGTPSLTNIIEHDTEVGDALPVRQHDYWLPIENRQRMAKKVEC